MTGAALGILCWASAGVSMAEASPPRLPFHRVKWTQSTMGELLREGYQRSSSFQSLVDRIEQSNAIVLVRLGYCKDGRVRACLTSVAGSLRERHLRIKVDPHASTNRLIAAIGHELRHALEVVEESAVIDGRSALALFRRVGNTPCGTASASGCETDAALETEARILAELYGKSPERPVIAAQR